MDFLYKETDYDLAFARHEDPAAVAALIAKRDADFKAWRASPEYARVKAKNLLSPFNAFLKAYYKP